MRKASWEEAQQAWAVIAWWHRNRPELEMTYGWVEGPIGVALIPFYRHATDVPHHVREARALLGFPRINRKEGERP